MRRQSKNEAFGLLSRSTQCPISEDAIICFWGFAMDDENKALSKPGSKPVVVHPGPPSIEDILRYVDPAPDDETERFVAAIYLGRREAAVTPPPE